MKKALIASMLAAGSAAAPFCVSQTPVTIPQGQQSTAPAQTGATPVQTNGTAGQQGGAAAGGQVQMSQPEYNAYTAITTQTDPAQKAAAGEAYLTQYPQSTVKASVLEQLVAAYSQANNVPKTLDAADRLLQVDPNNIRGLAIETSLIKAQGDQATDPAQKQSSYDKAADFASRGLKATKPASMSDADWATIQKQVTPYFYSAIGIDALTKKDGAGAISAYKSELAAVPLEQTQQPGPFLQDTYFLAQAYYQSTPPDYLNCTFYATRTAAYAPAQYQAQFQQLATYCYKKYHGGADGYEAVQAAAKANLNPPADFATSVKPAPTPEDTVKQVLASTPDLTKLALSDREYIIQNGTADEADKVFAPIKGKEVKVSGVVVSASDTSLQLAVSDDAKASTPKVADFAVTLKAAPKTAPAVDSAVDVVATFDSYTQKPLLISMSAGEIQAKGAAKPAARTPAARRPAARRR